MKPRKVEIRMEVETNDELDKLECLSNYDYAGIEKGIKFKILKIQAKVKESHAKTK